MTVCRRVLCLLRQAAHEGGHHTALIYNYLKVSQARSQQARTEGILHPRSSLQPCLHLQLT